MKKWEADKIYNNPETPYTKKLIDAIPEGKLEDIKKHLEGKGLKIEMARGKTIQIFYLMEPLMVLN